MDKTIADKLIYIPSDDAQNYPFLGLQLAVENGQSLKFMSQPIKIH